MKPPSKPAMPVKNKSIPEALSRHLSAHTRDDLPGVADYVERGTALVTPDALAALRSLRQPLRAKIDAMRESEQLRFRLEILATYFEENAAPGNPATPALREVAFALLYFLKGFDRIPDSVPEVGLLDDAMIVQVVLQQQAAALRGHWLRRGRTWPAEF